MKLKHLISTSALIFAGLPANAQQNIYMCKSCPANSTSPRGALSISDCTCNAGYEKSGESCSACGTGKYKSSSGNGSCSSCTNAPSYAHYTSGGGSSNSCPWECNSGFIKSGNSCVCPAGKTLVNGSCQSCDKGTYKPSAGNGSCTAASVGYYVSSEGATSQSACASAGAWKGQKSSQVCKGYGKGIFKNICMDGLETVYETIDANCGAASRTVYCTKTGSTSSTDNAGTETSSNIANCGPGYTCNGTCVQCDDNYYKPDTGNHACTKCENIPINPSNKENSTLACVSVNNSGCTQTISCACGVEGSVGYVKVGVVDSAHTTCNHVTPVSIHCGTNCSWKTEYVLQYAPGGRCPNTSCSAPSGH
ncbi:MAG: hypothetical protein IJ638_02980 [Alphaproteobacteria bacterium]|nr:hypothetical protein [Alphaproteobacteria bacterium]